MSEYLDNRAHRVRTLKSIIRQLHAGSSPEEVQTQLKEIVKACDHTEIAQMESELIDEGMDPKEIMSMCDLHAKLVSEILVDAPPLDATTIDEENQDPGAISLTTLNTPPQQPSPTSPKQFGCADHHANAAQNPLANVDLKPGHPIDTFTRENNALAEHIAQINTHVKTLATPNQLLDEAKVARYQARLLLNELMDIDKHYDRKENLLFSVLERHGITGPSTVMWGIDDQIREQLKLTQERFPTEKSSPADWQAYAQNTLTPAFDSVTSMIFKEQHILLPMAYKTLTDIEWAEIFEQSPIFGWCLVDPQEGYIPPKHTPTAATSNIPSNMPLDITSSESTDTPSSNNQKQRGDGDEHIMFATGHLTLDQLKLIFSTLPVDLTYVDADDRVRFFSEGPKRVFHRPKAVIGRLVQHCHPPGSVHIVDQILEDFKSGKQSLAEFWINMKGEFIHIRYYALRNEDGQYQGTLEVTQNLTHERALEGDRRLLQYD
ncbi:hypothetical protein KS4_09940 [Poriferisphaera corsica]|uniref:DUF438 domain-containing protein n=1 Tax=Poriferisphaera corsica TaxID=2528020 RepID=A0A517YRV9_9BACT|nr:DUF438 domain-containing protein [Poriferisphaera corsica]QDU32955.1 hypothetical protein KS4_09940 [Poriferisphaera corsica]